MRGIMPGLGLSFMLEGLKMMGSHWLVSAAGVTIMFLMLAIRRVPAMLILLVLGIGSTFVLNPSSIGNLGRVAVGFAVPVFPFTDWDWEQAFLGALVLGIPQVPLTLGNAVLGTVEENNRLFPDRPVTVREIALDHGLMNGISVVFGGIPICHGAGGMAGHVRFGARTGGSLVMLGSILLVLGLFFGRSGSALLAQSPMAVCLDSGRQLIDRRDFCE
jgi:MFS superfamily sulfate permease-like transporter